MAVAVIAMTMGQSNYLIYYHQQVLVTVIYLSYVLFCVTDCYRSVCHSAVLQCTSRKS
jgi:hypothetical protein